jgi:hypothetical protein
MENRRENEGEKRRGDKKLKKKRGTSRGIWSRKL